MQRITFRPLREQGLQTQAVGFCGLLFAIMLNQALNKDVSFRGRDVL